MIGMYFTQGTKVFGIQSLDFDATLEEVHDWKNEVTTNPVEYGSPVADHVIEQSDKLRLVGTITNSPLHGPLAGQFFGGETELPRTQTAFEAIRELMKKREAVVVYTKHAIYTDMVIETVSIPFNVSIGQEVQFTMELVNVRFVSTQMVQLPPGISAKKTAKGPAVSRKTEPQKTAGKSENQSLLDRYPKPKDSILKSLSKVLP